MLTFLSSHLAGFPLENETFHSVCLNYVWTQLIYISKHSRPWRERIIAARWLATEGFKKKKNRQNLQYPLACVLPCLVTSS